MKDIVEIALNPITHWRNTDSTVIYLGGYVIAALAVAGVGSGIWAFINGVFAQASGIAGL